MSAIAPDLTLDPEGNALALRRAQRLQKVHFADVRAQGLEPVILDKPSEVEQLRQVFGDTVPVIDLGAGGAMLDPLAGNE